MAASQLQWGEGMYAEGRGDLEMELEGGGGRRRGVVSVVGSGLARRERERGAVSRSGRTGVTRKK